MKWPMLGLGGAMFALAAAMKLSGDASDLHQHALPFWLFVAGLAGLFVGGWHRDSHRVALGAGAGAAGRDLAAAGAGAAPAMRTAPSAELSSLQRPAAKQAGKYETSVGRLSEADVIERIRSLEADNARLRAFLLEAKASMSR